MKHISGNHRNASEVSNGLQFHTLYSSHAFVQEGQISHFHIQEISLVLISQFFQGTYLLVLKALLMM